jgi:hypothetical protein
MGHSAKKKSVTINLTEHQIVDRKNETFFKIEGEGIIGACNVLNNNDPDNEILIVNFTIQNNCKTTGIKLRKGEVAEMTITIRRKK